MNTEVLILGATGYIGSAFVKELYNLGISHQVVSGRDANYYRRVQSWLDTWNPQLVVNCAAHIPQPSVSLCDSQMGETIKGNLLLPQNLANACESAGIPLMCLSTACLFDDAKEYTEEDAPIRGFGGHCGFYVGTKLIAEDVVRKVEQHYILRLRLPFDEISNSRNYLTKLAQYPRVYDHINSLTHRLDFVKAAIQLWKLRAPWGTYHVVNTGYIRAETIVFDMMGRIIHQLPEFVPGPCAGCKVSNAKLLAAGVKMRHVGDAVEESISKYH